MLKFYITQEDLLPFEPSLVDYFRSDNGDSFEEKYKAANRIIVNDIKNQGKKLKTLCTPLVLTTDSQEDEIERTRLVVNVTDYTAGAKIILKGSDDTEFSIVTEFSPVEKGQYTEILTQTYNNYKIESSGTIVFTAELVEQSYEMPFIYLLLSQMFRDKENFIDDIWAKKADEYYVLYVETLNQTLSSVDEDEDGEVDEVEISRPRLTR